MFEGFGGLVFKLESKRVVCLKPRIYELRDSYLPVQNHEFHELHIVNCVL